MNYRTSQYFFLEIELSHFNPVLWAERRSRGTSRFIDVQGAAAAKELRQNHPNLILTFGPELLAAGHDAAPAEGAACRGLARQLA